MTDTQPQAAEPIDAANELRLQTELLRKINGKLAFFAFVLVLVLIGWGLSFLTTY